jgi:hypothetical protein
MRSCPPWPQVALKLTSPFPSPPNSLPFPNSQHLRSIVRLTKMSSRSRLPKVRNTPLAMSSSFVFALLTFRLDPSLYHFVLCSQAGTGVGWPFLLPAAWPPFLWLFLALCIRLFPSCSDARLAFSFEDSLTALPFLFVRGQLVSPSFSLGLGLRFPLLSPFWLADPPCCWLRVAFPVQLCSRLKTSHP